MPRGAPVEVMGIWLRREGDHLIVSVEDQNGRNVEVIREFAEGPISHNVSEHGIRARLTGTVDTLPRLSDLDAADDDCPKCKGSGWVCENHSDEVAHECRHCGGAGVPCVCNPIFKKSS